MGRASRSGGAPRQQYPALEQTLGCRASVFLGHDDPSDDVGDLARPDETEDHEPEADHASRDSEPICEAGADSGDPSALAGAHQLRSGHDAPYPARLSTCSGGASADCRCLLIEWMHAPDRRSRRAERGRAPRSRRRGLARAARVRGTGPADRAAARDPQQPRDARPRRQQASRPRAGQAVRWRRHARGRRVRSGRSAPSGHLVRVGPLAHVRRPRPGDPAAPAVAARRGLRGQGVLCALRRPAHPRPHRRPGGARR